MYKYLLPIIFIFTIINHSLFPNKAFAEWAYLFVVWDGYTYIVSNEYVMEVDKVIGSVSIYSSIEGTYSGNFSNAYKEGTNYYSMKGIDTEIAIAIQEEDGKFKRADRVGEYAGAINSNEKMINEVIKTKESESNTNQLEVNFSILLFILLLTLILGIPLLRRK